MAIPIPSSLVEFILFGPLDDRRQLQDSPILGDVWIEYGKQPNSPLDLLIVPYRAEHPGEVAGAIEDQVLGPDQDSNTTMELPSWDQLQAIHNEDKGTRSVRTIAYLQGLVVASLTFYQMMKIVAPKTKWWTSRWRAPITPEAPAQHEVQQINFEKRIREILRQAKAWHAKEFLPDPEVLQSFERFLALISLLLWGADHESTIPAGSRPEDQVDAILKQANAVDLAQTLTSLTNEMLQDKTRNPMIWQVSLNRRALPALARSVPAVKADAAKTLFKVNCSEIGWAVIDSGIAGDHPAFMKDGKSRVKKSFDFKNFRCVVTVSNTSAAIRKRNLANLLHQENLILTEPIRRARESIAEAEKAAAGATVAREGAQQALKDLQNVGVTLTPQDPELVNEAQKNLDVAERKESDAIASLSRLRNDAATTEDKIIKEADAYLFRLADDARKKGPIYWELVQKFVEIAPGAKPETNHGTHVAGIIGASQEEATKYAKAHGQPLDDLADGMCPDIMLYDFRVLGRNITETEFAIIASLQFIRYLNDRDQLFTIHGANLSLSIPHDVRNFACGRTPICDECERLIASGVVVVAAAGNHGYKSFQTADGSYDSYAAFSITDPGNADNVLTVGATHRFWPHTYGISFFSSRGPTGDGRLKPDLVAPGERIRSTMPGNEWGDLDGTSMAAPHVSGAAAMLMARYSELIGQPLRIKRLLCESATDLGRERSFQGHGMLDVLRAFQAI
ncbi:MAG TPA: S8 family serine peptidase [Pyrinomonadaceae bacterium]|nr:S8 family serine peptidase [Pyrinomonadaceae bacterium]